RPCEAQHLTLQSVLHFQRTLTRLHLSRWGVPERSGAEKNPLNLNQVMLAEEVRDDKDGVPLRHVMYREIPSQTMTAIVAAAHSARLREETTRGQSPSCRPVCGCPWMLSIHRPRTGPHAHHLYLRCLRRRVGP